MNYGSDGCGQHQYCAECGASNTVYVDDFQEADENAPHKPECSVGKALR